MLSRLISINREIEIMKYLMGNLVARGVNRENKTVGC